MKLRTRLALAAGVIMMMASLLGGGLSFRMCWQVMREQAVADARLESQQVLYDFEAYAQNLGDNFTGGMGAYYLKSRQDDYSILLEKGAVVYNQTLLDAGALYRQTQETKGYLSCLQRGRRLLVFSWQRDNLYLMHIVDVTSTYLRLYKLGVQIAGVSLAGVLLAGGLLFWALSRALRPLQALSTGARNIAAGAYQQRVPEGRTDEIGELGRDFNRMAQAVEEHIRQVEASEEKKTLFMGSLTHELKTPLTAISGYAQTLRSAKLGEQDREMALAYIWQESKRLDRLAKKMLRLLELERETALDVERLPIRQLLEEACRVCLPAAGEKGVRIVQEDCPGEVEGDRDLLVDVFVNLVDNAVKASKPGGVVRLYAAGGSIVVEDQGQGIPPEELARLTEPFYMVDKSRSRKSGGAGLGLALVAVILRRHRMALCMESEGGKGTKATVVTGQQGRQDG